MKWIWINGGSFLDYWVRNIVGRIIEDIVWIWKDGVWIEERGLFLLNVNLVWNFIFLFVLLLFLWFYFIIKYYESWIVLIYDWRNR